MQVRIEPGGIAGTVAAPSSKSMTQRAYAAALLHRGQTVIRHAGPSDDELAALQVIQQLGAKVLLQEKDSIHILSTGITPVTGIINCGESGLAARLFSPIAATFPGTITVEGSGSLPGRFMDGFKEVFAALQVVLPGFNGYLPVTIQGPMAPRSLHIDASGGSQLLSGLLMALCHIATEPVTIEVAGLKSKPYIDLTLQVLSHFGQTVHHNNYRSFYIDPARFSITEGVEIDIEGDWSSASALLVAGAVSGSVTIQNLDINSAQADRVVLDILRNAGAVVTVEDNAVSVKKARLHRFEFDATDCPDLFPILSILGACCTGESYIKGIHRLFNKESNRAESISEMLQNFDVPFSIEDDALCITGVRKLQGTVIDTYNDHRIAMAAATGALKANGPVDILNASSVNKSYPDFFKDFILCGGRCTFNESV